MTLVFAILVAFLGTDLADQKKDLELQLQTSESPGDIHLELSRILVLLGDVKNGKVHAEKALELLPESPDAHHGYAVALRHKMEKSPISWLKGKRTYFKHLEQAIALDPSFAAAYVELANFHLQAPSFLGAEADKAQALGERLAKFDLKRGGRLILQAFDKKNDPEGRYQTLKTLTQQLPDDAEFHLAMGTILQNREKYKEALTYLDRFTEGALRDKGIIYQAARSRILGGFELPKAISLLDQYVSLVKPDDFPSAADARWRQGLAYKGLGKIEEARTCFYKALSLDAAHSHAKESLAEMD